MRDSNLWIRAKGTHIQTSEDIVPGFNIGFDNKIPEDTQTQLRKFVKWVEDNFNIPITLWVDFEYKHYLLGKDGKRVGYLFHYADFPAYPVFSNKGDIPIIRLPVRTEYSTMDEILGSFIEAITDYFAWVCNEISDGYETYEDDVAEVLQAYWISNE